MYYWDTTIKLLLNLAKVSIVVFPHWSSLSLLPQERQDLDAI